MENQCKDSLLIRFDQPPLGPIKILEMRCGFQKVVAKAPAFGATEQTNVVKFRRRDPAQLAKVLRIAIPANDNLAPLKVN